MLSNKDFEIHGGKKLKPFLYINGYTIGYSRISGTSMHASSRRVCMLVSGNLNLKLLE